jgi:hypothetical protein
MKADPTGRGIADQKPVVNQWTNDLGCLAISGCPTSTMLRIQRDSFAYPRDTQVATQQRSEGDQSEGDCSRNEHDVFPFRMAFPRIQLRNDRPSRDPGIDRARKMPDVPRA